MISKIPIRIESYSCKYLYLSSLLYSIVGVYVENSKRNIMLSILLISLTVSFIYTNNIEGINTIDTLETLNSVSKEDMNAFQQQDTNNEYKESEISEESNLYSNLNGIQFNEANPFMIPESLQKRIEENKEKLFSPEINNFDIKLDNQYIIHIDSSKDKSNLFTELAEKRVIVIRDFSKYDFLTIELPSDLTNTQKEVILDSLSHNQNIKQIEKNAIVLASYIPNDPLWNDQYAHQMIGIAQAWEYGLGSPEIVVAVIDTGINYTHEDLSQNYLPIGYDFVNLDDDPMDDNFHGTACAGLIAASINNNIGIAGLANVSVFSEKVLDCLGYGSADQLAAGIYHAVDHGANILSMSLGSFENSSLVFEAIQYASSHNVVIIAASGNDGFDFPCYPAAYPGVISVGAIDQYAELTYFSNYGKTLDLVAPGVDILTCFPDNAYGTFTGTSASAPYVAGVAALAWSIYPDYNRNQIERLLYYSATDLGKEDKDDRYGWGMINASASLEGLPYKNIAVSFPNDFYLPGDQDATVQIIVSNRGLESVSSIQTELHINGSLVQSFEITELASCEEYILNYIFTPEYPDYYNITAIVEVVLGETITDDNTLSVIYETLSKAFSPEYGEIIEYSDSRMINVFSSRFRFDEMISSTKVLLEIHTIPSFEDKVNTTEPEFFFTVDLYTLDYNLVGYSDDGSLGFFIYPSKFLNIINPDDLVIGKNITLELFKGWFEDFVVKEESIFDYNNQEIEAMVLESESKQLIYDKTTGILLGYGNIGGTEWDLEIDFSSRISSIFNIHNIKVGFREVYLPKEYFDLFHVNEDLYCYVKNTGSYSMSFSYVLQLNHSTVIENPITLSPGEFEMVKFKWIPYRGKSPYKILFQTNVSDDCIGDNLYSFILNNEDNPAPIVSNNNSTEEVIYIREEEYCYLEYVITDDDPYYLVEYSNNRIDGYGFYRSEWLTYSLFVESDSGNYTITILVYDKSQNVVTMSFKICVVPENFTDEEMYSYVYEDASGPAINPINSFASYSTAPVIIETYIIDPSGVTDAYVHFRVNNQDWQNIQMEEVNSILYQCNLGEYSLDDFIEYYIVSTDNSVNAWTTTEDYFGNYLRRFVEYLDKDSPIIQTISYPSQIYVNNNLTISAEISDYSNLFSVRCILEIDNEIYNQEMEHLGGNIYEVYFESINTTGEIAFYFLVIDNSPFFNEIIDDNVGNYYWILVNEEVVTTTSTTTTTSDTTISTETTTTTETTETSAFQLISVIVFLFPLLKKRRKKT